MTKEVSLTILTRSTLSHQLFPLSRDTTVIVILESLIENCVVRHWLNGNHFNYRALWIKSVSSQLNPQSQNSSWAIDEEEEEEEEDCVRVWGLCNTTNINNSLETFLNCVNKLHSQLGPPTTITLYRGSSDRCYQFNCLYFAGSAKVLCRVTHRQATIVSPSATFTTVWPAAKL